MKNAIIGFAMIEVLIAMSVLAVVFLSLLSYQVSVFRYTQCVYFSAIAQLQLMNLSESLRVNRRNAYREKALKQWNQDNAALLPNGVGDFALQNNHDCQITLYWYFRKQRSESIDVFC